MNWPLSGAIEILLFPVVEEDTVRDEELLAQLPETRRHLLGQENRQGYTSTQLGGAVVEELIAQELA